MAKAKKDDNGTGTAEIKAKWNNANWDWTTKKGKKGGGGDGMNGFGYFLGFLGALVYYMQAASGFGAVLTGFLKAAVWPAYLVYKLLESFYGVVS